MSSGHYLTMIKSCTQSDKKASRNRVMKLIQHLNEIRVWELTPQTINVDYTYKEDPPVYNTPKTEQYQNAQPIQIIKNPIRAGRMCPYSCMDRHSLRRCIKFLPYKQKCSKQTYISSTLADIDCDGFCSAGVAVYSRDEQRRLIVLMLRQDRPADSSCPNDNMVSALNFPGGGRETLITENEIRAETYIETAISEFTEEMGELIGNHPFLSHVSSKIQAYDGPLLWCGSRLKFVLIPIYVDYSYVNSLRLLDNISCTSEAQNFEWTVFEDLTKSQLHNFTVIMIESLAKLETPFFS